MVPEPGLTDPGPVPPDGRQAPSEPPQQAPNPWPPGPYPPVPYGDPGYYPPGPYTGPAARPAALPVAAREYHEFFRAPRFRWWKPILSLLMFGAAWLLGNLLLSGTALAIDVAAGRVRMSDLSGGDVNQMAQVLMTPLGFTANNLSLALAVPLAGLTAWAVFGQRPRWMSSITGGFRWSLFGRFALVAAPIFLLSLGVDIVLTGVPELRWTADSLFLVVAILVTTPFQAAGEEYGLRGIIARSVGSWFGARRLGLVVAGILSSLLFMVLHAADNVWLNTYYFSVGVICSILVWRTGGLEAAVALHVCNNLISEVTLPFGGLEGAFERGPESAGPTILFQLAFTLAVMAGMLWLARRWKLPRSAAPAAPEQSGPGGVFWTSTHTTA
nr:CPBP family intramembrane glutamic endopeptidase [Propionicimonas sp.]